MIQEVQATGQDSTNQRGLHAALVHGRRWSLAELAMPSVTRGLLKTENSFADTWSMCKLHVRLKTNLTYLRYCGSEGLREKTENKEFDML